MHPDALAWVASHAPSGPVSVLDIGGRDVNGTPRHLFPDATRYIVVDPQPGWNVDVVADIVGWETDEQFDITVCLEVLEHVEQWPAILNAAHRLTRDLLIVTAAGPGRLPHSAVDGGPVRRDEHYENITADALATALGQWRNVLIDVTGADIRAVARR